MALALAISPPGGGRYIRAAVVGVPMNRYTLMGYDNAQDAYFTFEVTATSPETAEHLGRRMYPTIHVEVIF